MTSSVRLAILAACGMAVPAFGQDSVSKNQGLPGDAIDAWTTSEQINRYVVDLTTVTSTWGNDFALGPIIKQTKSAGEGFFTMFSGAQGMSITPLYNVCRPSRSFSFWDTAGAGVNEAQNDAPASQDAPVRGMQFGVAFNGSESNAAAMLGGTVFLDPTEPTRLYVTRTVAAVNGPTILEHNSSFGLGEIDSNGNLHFRADEFAATGGDPILNDSYFRVAVQKRDGSALNTIGGAGGSDTAATTGVLRDSVDAINTPSIIPQMYGARPVLIGTNFVNEYIYEATPGSATVDGGAHLGAEDDHRGNVFFSPTRSFAGSVGTVAMLGHDPSTSHADAIILFGANADGSVTSGKTLRLTLPPTLTDNDDGFDTATEYGPAWAEEFGNFRSQVAFQGGNGSVAVGTDQAGRTIVSAVVQIAGAYTGAKNPTNVMAVARITPGGAGGDITTGTVEWTIAGHNETGAGKSIKDGPGGSQVGRLIEYNIFSGKTDPSETFFGPSMSPPMIDSVGNLYYLTTAELDHSGVLDNDQVLVRAVYDPATFSYQLEEMLELGWRFDGPNSATEYQIRGLEIVDNNSISSATTYSGNITRAAGGDIGTAGLSPADPRTLGGLVFAALLVYDTNGDGEFVPDTDPTDPTPSDESYRVLMYIGSGAPAPFCAADFNRDGRLNINDFISYQSAWQNRDIRADFDCNGSYNVNDFISFQAAWRRGCSF